jgi:hypothetical protein
MTVRQRAVVALGCIKDPETISILIGLVSDDKNGRIKYDAYQAIRKFGKKAAQDQDEIVHPAAVWALGLFKVHSSIGRGSEAILALAAYNCGELLSKG